MGHKKLLLEYCDHKCERCKAKSVCVASPFREGVNNDWKTKPWEDYNAKQKFFREIQKEVEKRSKNGMCEKMKRGKDIDMNILKMWVGHIVLFVVLPTYAQNRRHHPTVNMHLYRPQS